MSVRRILVMTPNWLGDFAMAFPLIEQLSKRYPEAELAVLSETALAPLAHWHAGVRKCFSQNRKGLGWLRSAREARRFGPDLTIVLPNSLRSGLQSFLIGGAIRLGYEGDARRMLLTNSLPGKGDLSLHQGLRYGKLLECIGEEFSLSPVLLTVPSSEQERCRKWRETEGLLAWDSYALLCPGAGFGRAKRWPEEKFSALSEWLIANSMDGVILVGTAQEHSIGEVIRQNVSSASQSRVVNAAGKTDLPLLGALLADAALVVGNDSGPMHLSAAMGTPTVGIFLSTSCEGTYPLGHKTAWVAADVPCRPCYKRECPLDTWDCLKKVSVKDVTDVMEKLLSTEEAAK